jgi:flagellar motility protein MotE (MotC chaperone)
MFNITPDEVATRINSLSFEEKMILVSGISLQSAQILHRMFPENAFIEWFVKIKQQTN